MEKDLLFKEVFLEKGQYLAGALRGIGCKEDEIEDLMQTTYMRAYEKYDQLKNVGSFLSWLTSIAMNEAYKKKKKDKRVILLESEEAFEKIIDEKAWADYFVENDLAVKLLLKEAMAKLPIEYLVPFKMNMFENYKYREIAMILDLKEGTVKSRINRAKAHMKNSLSDDDDK